MAKKIKDETSTGEIIIFKSVNGPQLEVRFEKESFWLNLNQISSLFDTDKSGISRHIKNIYKNGELGRNSTDAKIATVQSEGELEENSVIRNFRIVQFHRLSKIKINNLIEKYSLQNLF